MTTVATAMVDVVPDTRRLRIMAEELLVCCDRIEARVASLALEDAADVLRDDEGNEISVPDGGEARTAPFRRIKDNPQG